MAASLAKFMRSCGLRSLNDWMTRRDGEFSRRFAHPLRRRQHAGWRAGLEGCSGNRMAQLRLRDGNERLRQEFQGRLDSFALKFWCSEMYAVQVPRRLCDEFWVMGAGTLPKGSELYQRPVTLSTAQTSRITQRRPNSGSKRPSKPSARSGSRNARRGWMSLSEGWGPRRTVL